LYARHNTADRVPLSLYDGRIGTLKYDIENIGTDPSLLFTFSTFCPCSSFGENRRDYLDRTRRIYYKVAKFGDMLRGKGRSKRRKVVCGT
jgi:hypothetical protein